MRDAVEPVSRCSDRAQSVSQPRIRLWEAGDRECVRALRQHLSRCQEEGAVTAALQQHRTGTHATNDGAVGQPINMQRTHHVAAARHKHKSAPMPAQSAVRALAGSWQLPSPPYIMTVQFSRLLSRKSLPTSSSPPPPLLLLPLSWPGLTINVSPFLFSKHFSATSNLAHVSSVWVGATDYISHPPLCTMAP